LRPELRKPDRINLFAGWKARDRIDERARWYEEPDEIE
jgi:hypothetical protein